MRAAKKAFASTAACLPQTYFQPNSRALIFPFYSSLLPKSPLVLFSFQKWPTHLRPGKTNSLFLTVPQVLTCPIDFICTHDFMIPSISLTVRFYLPLQVLTLVVAFSRQPVYLCKAIYQAHRQLRTKLIHTPRLSSGNRPHMGFCNAHDPACK